MIQCSVMCCECRGDHTCCDFYLTVTCCECRGDHTCCDFYLTVLPANTDAAVFSIDGSFTASVSIMGKDPKVRPGAVDVVRFVVAQTPLLGFVVDLLDDKSDNKL